MNAIMRKCCVVLLLVMALMSAHPVDLHAGVVDWGLRQIPRLLRYVKNAAPQIVEELRPVAHFVEERVPRLLEDTWPQMTGIERALARQGEAAVVAERKVIKRAMTFEPDAVDAMGRTNRERMRAGLAPIGKDGKPVELHHLHQKDDGVIMELTHTEHRANSAELHQYRTRSEIDRAEFNAWKQDYWKVRAQELDTQ